MSHLLPAVSRGAGPRTERASSDCASQADAEADRPSGSIPVVRHASGRPAGGRPQELARVRISGRSQDAQRAVSPRAALLAGVVGRVPDRVDALRHARQTLGEVATEEDSAGVRRYARHAPSFAARAALFRDRHGRVRRQVRCQVRRGAGRMPCEVGHLAEERTPRGKLSQRRRRERAMVSVDCGDPRSRSDQQDSQLRHLPRHSPKELPEVAAAVRLGLRAGPPSVGGIRRCSVR